MVISIIVAVSKNHVIGDGNKLLWNLPVDMAFFKATTQGGIVMMGRNTYLSIPEKFRPLPNRFNIVISKNEKFIKSITELNLPNLVALDSIEVAINLAKSKNSKELFIIGGASIYKQTMKDVQKIYLTKVDCELVGDATFYFQKDNNWI